MRNRDLIKRKATGSNVTCPILKNGRVFLVRLLYVRSLWHNSSRDNLRNLKIQGFIIQQFLG